ncbi:rifin PIR protein,putative [Plasmodium sp. DRC-Itaito]|nr:rifin PIR protein,putative [Plasmodium sp. DRC-Itaito]
MNRHFQSNGYTSPHIRSLTKITTSRTLSEFDKYTNNYDNDPAMKEMMKRYNERTAIRLKVYDERKKEKQKEYKEKSDKDIKDIIVKDKIQKQLTKKLLALEKVTDTDNLFKGKNQKAKKGCNKSKKTLSDILSEWNILPNIEMYEWIPFISKEAKIDCNIKNMKQPLNKIGYIRPNNFVTFGNKDGKNAIDLDHLFSSIMNSSNTLLQKYMEDDVISYGSIFKKQSGFVSFALYALWEILEHMVFPVVAPILFKRKPSGGGFSVNGAHGNGSGGTYYVNVLYD